ncbi:MAG: hypothetical protein HON65_15365, partial [Rhodospirillales bacterium]|nr:hypothetical protein [Rhodospirillales bacterium]
IPSGNGGGVRAALSVVNGGAALAPAYSEHEAVAVAEEIQQEVLTSLTDITALAEARREMSLQAFLYNNARLVSFAPGRVELNGGEYADAATIQKLRNFLHEETRENWIVSISASEGEPTLKEQHEAAQNALKQQMSEHPLVKSVLEAFPESKVTKIQDHAPLDPDDS